MLALRRIVFLIGVVVFASLEASAKPSLRGSRSAVHAAYAEAKRNDLSFLVDKKEFAKFVDAKLLVRVWESDTVELHDVQYPYARPTLALLVRHLALQYKATCGEKLVVTSLVRVKKNQPLNASRLSVHPAGIAVDLRIPKAKKCRSWLEETLLALEDARVVDATRERRPPHYHVVVFPKKYESYVAKRPAHETQRKKS